MCGSLLALGKDPVATAIDSFDSLVVPVKARHRKRTGMFVAEHYPDDTEVKYWGNGDKHLKPNLRHKIIFSLVYKNKDKLSKPFRPDALYFT